MTIPLAGTETTITTVVKPYEWMLRLNPDDTHGMYYEQAYISYDGTGKQIGFKPERLHIDYTPPEVEAIVGQVTVELTKRLEAATATIAEQKKTIDEQAGRIADLERELAGAMTALESFAAQNLALQGQLASRSAAAKPAHETAPPAA